MRLLLDHWKGTISMSDALPDVAPVPLPEPRSASSAQLHPQLHPQLEHVEPLTGTLPMRPFHDRFYGEVAADLATARVAAVVCDDQGALILLSLVGPDVTCAAVLARVFAGQPIIFAPTPVAPETSASPATPASPALTGEPPESVASSTGPTRPARVAPTGPAGTANGVSVSADDRSSWWRGPAQWRRSPCPMQQFHSPLVGTRERHYLALAAFADLRALNRPTAAPSAHADHRDAASSPTAEPQAEPQYVLGNADELTPNHGVVMGHLRAIGLPFLPNWTAQLWAYGQREGLITPALALGMRAWRLDTDGVRWAALLAAGIQGGWLVAPPDTL